MRPLPEVDTMSTSATRASLPHLFLLVFAAAGLLAANAMAAPVYYEVVHGGHPHDVAATPVAGGPVYYTAQIERQARHPRSRAAARSRRSRSVPDPRLTA